MKALLWIAALGALAWYLVRTGILRVSVAGGAAPWTPAAPPTPAQPQAGDIIAGEIGAGNVQAAAGTAAQYLATHPAQVGSAVTSAFTAPATIFGGSSTPLADLFRQRFGVF